MLSPKQTIAAALGEGARISTALRKVQEGRGFAVEKSFEAS